MEKSFALTFLVLMAIPALPLPTGGLTHVFEIITMLLCLELIAQRKDIWLPQKWKHHEIGRRTRTKMLPILIKLIHKTEKLSKPRMSGFLAGRVATTLFGVVVLIFTLGAFLSPPFSGLDTLPSLGVLLISLGFILEDIYVVFVGFFIGIGGITISIFFGTIVVEFITHLF